MNPEIKSRVEKIMGLAYELNPTETWRETTDLKPTVFVRFVAHVGKLEVRIFKKGWFPDADPDIENEINLKPESAIKRLDETISVIEQIKKQWETNGAEEEIA